VLKTPTSFRGQFSSGFSSKPIISDDVCLIIVLLVFNFGVQFPDFIFIFPLRPLVFNKISITYIRKIGVQ
jgi:hypothetical protein